MALNIKNEEAERLAAEVAGLAGETKTRAVQLALRERRDRLAMHAGMSRLERMRRFLETEVWPQLPENVRGVRLTKAEREEILGYGPEGH